MKIVRQRTFRKRVTVEVPDGDGVEVQSFTAHFVALKPDQLEAFMSSTGEQLLSEVLIGWEGLTDDRTGDEQPFPFTPENRTELLSDTFVRRDTLAAYFAAMAGVKTGN